ncbi:hypothetical protein ACFL34_06000, partial [Candidatus Sumerlaeota bacterium]
YLRAVAFLGATVPQVKGLRDVAFRENEPEHLTIEFAAMQDAADDQATADETLTRDGAPDEVAHNSEAGVDEVAAEETTARADGASPEENVDIARVGAIVPAALGRQSPAVDPKTEPMAEDVAEKCSVQACSEDERPTDGRSTEDFAEEVERFREENARLRERLAGMRRDQERAAFERFLERQREAGKPVNAWVEHGVTDLFVALGERTAAFGDQTAAESEQECGLGEMLQAVLAATPAAVQFGELAPEEAQRARLLPPQVSVDSAELTARAEAWLEHNPGQTFAEALVAVAREG